MVMLPFCLVVLVVDEDEAVVFLSLLTTVSRQSVSSVASASSLERYPPF